MKADTEVALDFMKDAVREEPIIQFHREKLYHRLPARSREPSKLDDWINLENLVAAARITEKECPGLAVHVRDNLWGIDVSIHGNTEWNDILRWAHGTGGDDVSKKLSPAAEALLERVESGELSKEFRTERSVRHRIQYFGYSSNFDRLIAELRLKCGVEMNIERQEDKRKQHASLLKFSISSRHDPSSPPNGLNPILPGNEKTPMTRREFRRWFSQQLIAAPFNGSEARLFWSITSRKEFFRCFPMVPTKEALSTGLITKLLVATRQNPAFQVGWDFSYEAFVWSVSVGPKSTWEQTRALLQEELSQPTTEERFHLSTPAAELYDWVVSLGANSLELGLTPVVETAIDDKRLLLDCPWEKGNFRLYLALLCEEITERTPVVLQLHPWYDHDRLLSRILVKQKPPIESNAR